MGRKRNKKNKDATCEPEASFPFSLPHIIPIETFKAVADYMLQLPAPQRNVFLTAKEYSMEYINPMHLRTKDSPTHMIVFCLRLIMSDHFHPIGVVQINKRVEYIKKLAVVWKAFIQDLSILRIFVIGSMSPCTLTFHDVLIELTQNPNLEDNAGPIIYSVWPYKEILHLYDYYSLIEEFQEAFYDRIEVFFLTRPSPSEKISDSKSKSLQLYCASWNDIQLTTAVSVDVEDPNIGPEELIFNKRFRNAYEAMSKQGILSTETRSSTDRLLDLLWQYVDITFTNINLNPYALQELYDKHEDLRIALATAQFRWYVIEVSGLNNSAVETKLSSSEMHVMNHACFESQECDNSLPTDQNSIKSGSSIELNDNEIDNLINMINNTPAQNDGTLHYEDTYFDKFIQKIVYDDYDLYIKTCPIDGDNVTQSAEEQKRIASRAERALAHDHDYFSGVNDIQDPSTDLRSESETTKMLREYFGDLKQKHKKPAQDSQNSLIGNKDYQNSNTTVGNENINKENHINAQCDNNNCADQKLLKDVVESKLNFSPSEFTGRQPLIDSRSIKKFQYEMEQLTVITNEIINSTTAPSVEQKDNMKPSKINAGRKPYRGMRLIPYGKPSLDLQNSEQLSVNTLQEIETILQDSTVSNDNHQKGASSDVQMIEIENTNNSAAFTLPAKVHTITNLHRNKNVLNTDSSWEYSQSRITINGLDLANCNAHVLGAETESIMGSALDHCSNNFVSYENALNVEKPVVPNSLTQSVDSLVELVNTFEADNQISEFPCKHIILKSTTKKIRQANIPSAIGTLERCNMHVNSLKSSTSDSVLYIKKTLSGNVNASAPRNVWKQPRDVCGLFMNHNLNLKSPIQELKELMKTIPAFNVYQHSIELERDTQTYSPDYNNILLNSFSTKSENYKEIEGNPETNKVFLKNHTIDDQCTNEHDSAKTLSSKMHFSETFQSKSPLQSSDVCGSCNNTLPEYNSEGHNGGAFLETTAAAAPEINSAENSFNFEDTADVDEIDYLSYRKNLVSILCDHKKPGCDIFRDKETFNMLYSAIPPEAEIVRVTNDWLCTFKGYLKLKEILDRRQVKFVRSKLLCLDHIDFFVALIKKLKNNILSTVYEGPGYKLVDYKCAFDMLYSGDGVYILTQDEDTVKSL